MHGNKVPLFESPGFIFDIRWPRCNALRPFTHLTYNSRFATIVVLEPKFPAQDDATEASSTQSPIPQNVEEAGGKAAFLATFTPQDDKDIMRKVDKRFLLLIGIL